MATLLGALLVSLGLESGQFRSGLTDAEKQMKATQKNMERVGKNFTKVGAAFTVGVTTPILAGAAAAVAGFQDQQQAMAQVNSALASMGPVAGRTAQQLSDAADAMEMHSLIDADVILTKVTANLLTFGNVSGAVFDRAQQAAIDMAQRLGSDPQAAAIMLGKALNDPVKGITALTRVGVSFSAAQIATIKAMAATGKTAAAQGLIMTEVERQFKGAAQAAADTSPWRQAQVAINQAGDTIGEALLPVIPPIANAIRDAALAFGSLSPQMQQFAIYGLAAGAALGPVVAAVGGLVSIGARALPVLFKLGEGSAFVAEGATGAEVAATGLGRAIGVAIPWVGALAGAAALAYAAFQHWDEITAYVDGVAERMNATKGDIDNWFSGLNDWAAKVDQRFGIPSQTDFTDSAGAQLSALWAKVGQYDLQHWADGVDASIASAFRNAVASAQRLYEGIKTWMHDKLGATLTWVSDKAKSVGDAFFTLYDRVVGHSYVPDMVDEIGAQMARLDGNMVGTARRATDATAQAFQALQQRVAPILDRLFPDQAKLNAFRKDMADLTDFAAKGGLTPDQAEEAQRRLRNEQRGQSPDYGPDAGITEPVIDIWKPTLETGTLISDTWGEIGKANERLGDSFATTTKNITSSLQGLMGSIKSGDWLGALGGLADAFTQLAGGGLFGKKMQANASAFRGLDGARAMGGPVLPRGSYLIGERGPEILRMGGQGGSIVPNHELGGPVSIHVAVEEGAMFRPVVRSEAGQVSYSMAKTSTRASALRGRQALA
ncbi:MAG: phage tail length tape measure family protein [Sphingomonas bacterium]|nr:phage tail length tape measure family protein [Sphingomonas bacterium]